MKTLKIALPALAGLALITGATAQDAAAEMARKLQDPLANMTAIMTDNDVSWGTGNDSESYGFQFQPVKAFSFDDIGMNFIARAIIPFIGQAPDSQRVLLGAPVDGTDSYTWGLSDISTQFFFSPKSDSPWKWGVGPMVSLKTRTNERLAGPGWGGGAVGVLTGSLTEDISASFIGGHLWGQESGFSTSFLQPMMFYNVPGAPGWAVGFNNTIAYDWNATSGNEWTVPLGVTIGKTFDLGGGHGLDINCGPYWNVVKPEGAADFVFKFGLTWLMP